ncbi:MAG: hypothetical protein CL946_10795 [Ectothiorhodospiraceae bacterium]|nr:hypothetical protein [Ectothiorhodospiraceae bacterium]
MKRAFLIIASLLLVFSSATSFAQDDEEQPRRSSRGSGGIFGAGGGPSGAWYFINTDVLNSSLTDKGMPELSTDGMFLFGGHGYAYIIIVPNLRIGGIGMGGSMSETNVDDGTFNRSELAVGFGGVTLDYTIPFGRFHIAIGTMLGAGSYTLTLTRGPNTDKSWEDLFGDPLIPSDSRLEMINGFFAYQPALTVEYDISPFIVASLKGGYFGTAGDTWELNGEFEVNEVPEFDMNNAFVRLDLTFGLFIGEN